MPKRHLASKPRGEETTAYHLDSSHHRLILVLCSKVASWILWPFLGIFSKILKHWPNHWFQWISNMYARMTPCVTFTKHKIYSCTIGSHTRFAMVWKHVLHSQLEASHLGSPTKRREEIAGESPHVKFGWLLKKLSHVTICDAEPQAAWSLQINKIGQNWHTVKVYTSAAITGSYLELPTSPIPQQRQATV